MSRHDRVFAIEYAQSRRPDAPLSSVELVAPSALAAEGLFSARHPHLFIRGVRELPLNGFDPPEKEPPS